MSICIGLPGSNEITVPWEYQDVNKLFKVRIFFYLQRSRTLWKQLQLLGMLSFPSLMWCSHSGHHRIILSFQAFSRSEGHAPTVFWTGFQWYNGIHHYHSLLWCSHSQVDNAPRWRRPNDLQIARTIKRWNWMVFYVISARVPGSYIGLTCVRYKNPLFYFPTERSTHLWNNSAVDLYDNSRGSPVISSSLQKVQSSTRS